VSAIDLAALDDFIAQLSAVPTVPDAHNPYAGDDANTAIRRANLRLYLHALGERRPSVMLVMEAPGYRGCRITGVPVTSRKIVHEGLPGFELFGASRGYRTTDDAGFERVWGEQSATIVWETMSALNCMPLIWNTYPFHPHLPGKPLTNRAPRRLEVAQGLPFLQALLSLFQPQQIIAVGNVAHGGLAALGITAEKVRHPAQGGKNAFVAGIQSLIAKA
jgi:uracil-DNA glycosylase